MLTFHARYECTDLPAVLWGANVIASLRLSDKGHYICFNLMLLDLVVHKIASGKTNIVFFFAEWIVFVVT